MAESSLQQLSSRLTAHQSQSQESQQLLHTLYFGVTHCCCLTVNGPGLSATALVPVPDCHIRAHDSSLLDQATVEQLLAHLQQVFTYHENQSQSLTSVSQQLEAYSASQAQAVSVLQAAIQLQEYPGNSKQLHCEDRKAPADLLQLAESVTTALASQAVQLTQTQSQILCLNEQLSQAQAQTDAAKSELAACKEQLGAVSHAAQTAQAGLRQVMMRQLC